MAVAGAPAKGLVQTGHFATYPRGKNRRITLSKRSESWTGCRSCKASAQHASSERLLYEKKFDPPDRTAGDGMPSDFDLRRFRKFKRRPREVVHGFEGIQCIHFCHYPSPLALTGDCWR